MSARAKEKFKRDREDENDPAVQPEVKPHKEEEQGDCTALSVAKGCVTEPVLTLEIGGKRFSFMVDTGAMVSLIQPGISKAQMQPCDVQARGVTGTQLEVLGEQKVKFALRNNTHLMEFEHMFVVSPSIRCSSGILGMDFLRQVGAEICLTDNLLTLRNQHFSLSSADLPAGVSPDPEVLHESDRGLITQEQEKVLDLEDGWTKDESCIGTVELAEAVSVPPLSVRIARCRVVRRNNPTMVVRSPSEVLVEAYLDLPGIYVARIVATLENEMSSSNARGSPPLLVKEKGSPLVDFVSPPLEAIVASCDGSVAAPSNGGGPAGTGTGEYLSEWPEGGLPVATASHRDDLQAEYGSLPVENGYGIQVDTQHPKLVQRKEGLEKRENYREPQGKRKPREKTQILGYVPI